MNLLSGSFWDGVWFVASWIVAALLAATLVRRFVSNQLLLDHNENAGFMFAVVGVVYAVLLAFVAVGAWERFAAAEVRTYDEANSLTQVYRGAAIFPQASQIRGGLRRYANLVIDREWPDMSKDQSDPQAAITIERVAQGIRNLHPVGAGPQNVHAALLADIDQVLRDRDDRLSMDATGLNGVVWTTLGAGALVTIGFTLLFGFKHRSMQYVMIGGLTFTIAIVFYLTAALDYPFHGYVSVQSHAFHTALHSFDMVDKY
ncbi:MAG TPA: DUF4239 domain-containing protein [Candidatus Baltobacteraceae bacterium]